MMFPGTMTRPPPPFTSTITRLSSRSLNFQDESFFRLTMPFIVETCRRSWKRWPNFHSMFQRWSCCQEFPANLKKNLKKKSCKIEKLNSLEDLIKWESLYGWQYLKVKRGLKTAAKGLRVSFPTVCLKRRIMRTNPENKTRWSSCLPVLTVRLAKNLLQI